MSISAALDRMMAREDFYLQVVSASRGTWVPRQKPDMCWPELVCLECHAVHVLTPELTSAWRAHCACDDPQPTLEMFGSWLTPMDCVRWPSLRPFLAQYDRIYLVSARCSTGCHHTEEILDGREFDSGDILADVEKSMRFAFSRVHGGNTDA